MSDVVIFGEKHSNCGVLKDSAGRVVGLQTDEGDYHYLGEACDMNGQRFRWFPGYPPLTVDRLVDLFPKSSGLDESQEEEYSRIIISCALAGLSHSSMKISLTFEGAGFSDRVLVEYIKKVERRKEPTEKAWEEASELNGDAESKLQTAKELEAKAQATLGQGVYFTGGALWIESMTPEEKELFNLLTKNNPDRAGWCLTFRQIAEELDCSQTAVMRRQKKLEKAYPEAMKFIHEKRSRNNSLPDPNAEETLTRHTDGGEYDSF